MHMVNVTEQQIWQEKHQELLLSLKDSIKKSYTHIVPFMY